MGFFLDLPLYPTDHLIQAVRWVFFAIFFLTSRINLGTKYISCCSDISSILMANRSVMQLNCCSSTLMTLSSAQAFDVLMAHFVAFSVLGGTACFWAFSMSFAWNAVAKRLF